VPSPRTHPTATFDEHPGFGICGCCALAALALACSQSTPAAAPGGRTPAEPAPRRPEAAPVAPPEQTPTPAEAHAVTKDGWITFRGTAQRTGRSLVAGPRRARPKWVFRTRGRIYADAAIAPGGETVYVASHDHHLYAVGSDGRERWSYDAGGKIWTSPSIGRDGTVYFGSDADRLVALYPDGRQRWIFSTEQPASKDHKPEAGRYDVDTSPALAADGSVIFGCHTNLFALRARSGSTRWVFTAGVGKAKIFSSPALGYDGAIYFGTQGRYFFALDRDSKVLWHHKTGRDNDSTPAVGDDGTIYFGSDDGKLRAIAPGGTPRWEADVGSPIRAPVAIGHDGTVLASTFGKRPFLAAYDPQQGAEKWRFEIEPGEGDFYGIQSGALVDRDGFVYFGGRDKHVYCLSPQGELVWRHETGDQVDSGPALGPDGTLYVGSDDGRMYAFAP
jgi:outer membrane protein assembly factor BamB